MVKCIYFLWNFVSFQGKNVLRQQKFGMLLTTTPVLVKTLIVGLSTSIDDAYLFTDMVYSMTMCVVITNTIWWKVVCLETLCLRSLWFLRIWNKYFYIAVGNPFFDTIILASVSGIAVILIQDNIINTTVLSSCQLRFLNNEE